MTPAMLASIAVAFVQESRHPRHFLVHTGQYLTLALPGSAMRTTIAMQRHGQAVASRTRNVSCDVASEIRDKRGVGHPIASWAAGERLAACAGVRSRAAM